ncbi:MAG: DNA-directed RNA polymerase subunit beta [Synergistaceae bacterium]|nr:DNA-directed RNA polymerase subunit beta [Synergistaceae bacterium]
MPEKKRQRLFFGRSKSLLDIPDMIEIQRDSYDWFYQENVLPTKRQEHGLQELLLDIFPIKSYDRLFSLEFVKYSLDPPAIQEDVARQNDMTWSRPVRATIRLVNHKTKEMKEEEIFLGDFPLMTERGTFIINGTERVVVNQLARSAGVYFNKEEGLPGHEICSAKIIPERGAWLEFALSYGDVISVNIDNRKKIPATLLLKAFGISNNDDLLHRLNCSIVEKNIEEDVKGRLTAEDVPGLDGSIIIARNSLLNREAVDKISATGRIAVKIWDIDHSLEQTIEKDTTSSSDEAMLEMFRRLRPNEPARVENAREYINSLFFDERRYNLGRVGRYKLNRKLGLEIDGKVRLLQLDDLVRIIQELMELKAPGKIGDDIDHLGNRRVRSIGELLQNQIRIGLLRMERIARERMTTIPELEKAMARELINVRPIAASLREFYGSGQLSQFMDQTNPLAEVTHRRRLSALGPGGLSRERAGFEARDVHYTHYGRVCPIETPEGPNIGLVSSLTTYARLNDYGFLITPRCEIKKGKLTGKIRYLSADEEDDYYVAVGNTPIDDDGVTISGVECAARHKDDIVSIQTKEIDFLDVSPKQIVSASTALIPFLEHDDANRALMGSNMQRQAVPLIFPQAPVVGTGIEHRIAKDSGSCVISDVEGVVTYVDSECIKVESAKNIKDFKLIKFRRSNHGTLIHQRPIVDIGDKIEVGEIIADGQAIENGELALGQNVMVAFVPWEGYNFEDAILLSENLVKEDKFSSIHIEEYEIEARDTKLGAEEITRDIPNVGEDMLRNLDENGIVRIGAEVNAGDILVGKVTPKGESDQTPEEKLLRAIFGEKAREVRDNSLKLPHGARGKIVSIKQMTRTENPEALSPGVMCVVKVYVAQLRKITVGDKMAGRHGNKGVVSHVLPVEDMPYLPDGTPVDVVLNPLGVPSRMNLGQVLETIMGFVAVHNGLHIATPVFEGAKEKEIFDRMEQLSRDKYPDLTYDGMITLRDGRTGEQMEKKVMVGCMYMLKLIHLVDDKIHARSTGPYSLITQQPLGGKAQFGGQRFGEMEVWALEGYGAANVLQEMLTIKSDDIRGRDKTYERIVKGQSLIKPGTPESFRVLVKELQGLGLDVEVQYSDGTMSTLAPEESDDERFSRQQPRKISFEEDSEKEISAEDELFIRESELPTGMSLLIEDIEGADI